MTTTTLAHAVSTSFVVFLLLTLGSGGTGLLPNSLAAAAAETCRFPDFVQSRRHDAAGWRDWRYHLTETAADLSSSAAVTFDGRFMRVDGVGESFRRECLLEIADGRYLASHRVGPTSTDNLYICMGFVRRSESVVQLVHSSIVRRMDPRLCAEHRLHLDDWPLVDRRRLLGRPPTADPGCSAAAAGKGFLSGGHDVRLYDRRHRRGVCDAMDAETRIEASCATEKLDYTTGNGEIDYVKVLFRFRWKDCVPVGLKMSVEQQTYCLASWVDDGNRFTIVGSTYDPDVAVGQLSSGAAAERAWCLREPAHTRGHPFTSVLFTDLVCDRRSIHNTTKDVIVVDATPSAAADWRTCADDYEGCTWEQGDSCQRTDCAKTCGLCNDTWPRPCHFDAELNGLWTSNDRNASPFQLDIHNDSVSFIAADGPEVEFSCVDWTDAQRRSGGTRERQAPPIDAHHVGSEHLIVTSSDDGCRPRYACLQLLRRVVSTSETVLRYRVSSLRPWSFPATDALDIDCSLFSFPSGSFSTDLQQAGTGIANSSLTSPTSNLERVGDCDVYAILPTSRSYDVTVGDAAGCVVYAEPLPAAIRLLLQTGCGIFADNLRLELDCVGQSETADGDSALLLSTNPDALFVAFPMLLFGEISTSGLCALFPESDPTGFYLLPGDYCRHNASTSFSFDADRHRPLAVFGTPKQRTAATAAVPDVVSPNDVISVDDSMSPATLHSTDLTTSPPDVDDNSRFRLASASAEVFTSGSSDFATSRDVTDGPRWHHVASSTSGIPVGSRLDTSTVSRKLLPVVDEDRNRKKPTDQRRPPLLSSSSSFADKMAAVSGANDASELLILLRLTCVMIVRLVISCLSSENC